MNSDTTFPPWEPSHNNVKVKTAAAEDDFGVTAACPISIECASLIASAISHSLRQIMAHLSSILGDLHIVQATLIVTNSGNDVNEEFVF